MEPHEWSRQEILQIASIVGTIITAVLSFITVRMSKTIHVMINERLSQMLTGAKAEGAGEERAAQDARDRAREKRDAEQARNTDEP
jgi:hypothetical protein